MDPLLTVMTEGDLAYCTGVMKEALLVVWWLRLLPGPPRPPGVCGPVTEISLPLGVYTEQVFGLNKHHYKPSHEGHHYSSL